MIFIFDLDHTVIDSSHRQLTKPDGSLDLAHWIENSTREKIFSDSLLPLANVMRRYKNEGHTIVVCTARTATQHDFDFLAAHDLAYDHILYRAAGDMRSDGEFKTAKLNALAEVMSWPSNWRKDACMFDDNVAVIRAMFADRLICFDAIKYNARLAA